MASPKVLFLTGLCSVFCMSMAQLPNLCGDTGRQCVEGRSVCVNGECQCIGPRYVWGTLNRFMCYRRSVVAGESKNDVALTTFNNETREFAYPCRYKMTHVRQMLKGRNKQILGTCEFVMHSFNKRFKGKVLTHGFDLAARVDYNNGTSVLRSIRVYGTLSNNVPDMTVLMQDDFLPNGPWAPSIPLADFNYNDNPNRIAIQTYWDAANSAQWFDFKSCGLEISFFPYDIVLRRAQYQVPGLSIAINCANKPVWLSNDRVMALAPHWQGGQRVSEIVVDGLSEENSLLDRAFRSGVVQNQPDAEPACISLGNSLDACDSTDRPNAYDNCAWMLSEASFIKCASRNGLSFVTLFERCVAEWCSDLGTCDQLKQDISDACGHLTRPSVVSFLSGAGCP